MKNFLFLILNSFSYFFRFYTSNNKLKNLKGKKRKKLPKE